MNYRIEFDNDKCVACNACAIACMDQNDINTREGEEPFRKISGEEEMSRDGVKLKYVMTSCLHCADAPCAEACPTGCIEIDEETGFVVYDESKCTGCRLCMEACIYNAISFSRDGKMRKCDGCFIRVKNKMEPACVRNCPTGSLKLCIKD